MECVGHMLAASCCRKFGVLAVCKVDHPNLSLLVCRCEPSVVKKHFLKYTAAVVLQSFAHHDDLFEIYFVV